VNGRSIGQPIAKPRPPRVPLWVTEKELSMIAAAFSGFQGGLAEAIHAALLEARKARTEHNRALRAYRNERRTRGKHYQPNERNHDAH
jgi:hypothetical protein